MAATAAKPASKPTPLQPASKPAVKNLVKAAFSLCLHHEQTAPTRSRLVKAITQAVTTCTTLLDQAVLHKKLTAFATTRRPAVDVLRLIIGSVYATAALTYQTTNIHTVARLLALANAWDATLHNPPATTVGQARAFVTQWAANTDALADLRHAARATNLAAFRDHIEHPSLPSLIPLAIPAS